MAETVYKSVPDLDLLPGSLDGSEMLPVVKAGKTYRRSWATFFGSGWIANLLQAFTAFKAPDSVHADDADTVDGQDTATLHAAENLTGNIHLDRIPAELTGKNAATATLAAASSAAVVAQVSDNVAYPIALLESAGAGSKAIKSDSSGGTYNPSTNTAAINITGNAATASSAANASNASALGGVAAANFAKGIDIKYLFDVSSDRARSVNLPAIDGPSGTVCLYVYIVRDSDQDGDIVSIKAPVSHGFSMAFTSGANSPSGGNPIAANTIIAQNVNFVAGTMLAVKA